MNLSEQKNITFKILIGSILLIIIIPILITIIGYISVLTNENTEYQKKFYKSSFSGIINDIEIFDTNRNEYVVRLQDSAKNKKTIGITEITNFSSVQEGDTLSKKTNSYELEIKGRHRK